MSKHQPIVRCLMLLFTFGWSLLLAAQDKSITQSAQAGGDSLSVDLHTASGGNVTILKPKNNEPRRPRFLDGAAVGVDLVGPLMKTIGADWSQVEAFLRLNFYDKYFPIFELGLGEADHTGNEIDNHFHVRAPYFRIGLDYNFTKKHNGNRLFLGLRYACSSYKYDFDSPVPLTDPVWGTSQPLSLHNLEGHTHWTEIVFGVETKLWTIVRAGWDLRAKVRLSRKDDPVGTPWYIPGYGQYGDGIGLGATFKLLFDI